MTDNLITRAFVYGTLKPGGRYHYIAKDAGLNHQEESYLEGFDLYHLEPENYPALVEGQNRVYGWRFGFEDMSRGLAALDELEGIHLVPPEYRRVKARSQPDNVEVWVYVYNNLERLKASVYLLPDGIWQASAAPGILPKGLT
jgi:gamma-glutamylcyclotransferase (GGCT)/AIG2-like uncharacterized protein YtfP